jgi:hypothetical protein
MLLILDAEALKMMQVPPLERPILQTFHETFAQLVLLNVKLHEGLGEGERAFQLLYRAYGERRDHLLELNSQDDFDSLSTNPRFLPLLKKIGLEK